MQWAVESWAPEYGATTGDETLSDATDKVDVNLEVPAEDWAPRRPPLEPSPPELLFVDGVRRIDARIWVTDANGRSHQGIAATYGAGVVRCNGLATVIDAQIERGFFCEGGDLEPLVTRHGTYHVRPVGPSGPEALSLALQGAMADLEARVALDAGTDGFIVVDGPLRERRHLQNAIGYVKTHHVAYLPPVVADTVPALEPGERTPLFCIGDRFARVSWYQKLPGRAVHGWAGVVRGEVSPDVPLDQVAAMADLATSLLPRFASEAHKDPRAPQNLYPIAGLERELKRRLGDRILVARALHEAAPAA